MTGSWAAGNNASLDVLHQVQGSLTVAMIMAPRMDLMTCQPGDLIPGVVAENTEFFSYIPVVNEDDHIIGLLRAEEWFVADPPNSAVADAFEPLSERQVIGSGCQHF